MKTMNMISRTFVSSLLVLATTAAFAQETTATTKPTPSRVDHRIEMMKKHLAISDAQATQIASVLQQEHQNIATDKQRIKDAKPEDRMLARTQMQQDRLTARSNVLQQLTPDQRAKAETLRKHRAHRRSHHHMRNHMRMHSQMMHR